MYILVLSYFSLADGWPRTIDLSLTKGMLYQLSYISNRNMDCNKEEESIQEFIVKARGGIRTRDLLLGKETFYQLNYSRIKYILLKKEEYSYSPFSISIFMQLFVSLLLPNPLLIALPISLMLLQ